MIAFASALLALATPAVEPASVAPPAVDAKRFSYYPQSAAAAAVLDTALADAARSGKIALVVFGADWCHDSRGLAEVLTSSAFATEFGTGFTVTFIDVGKPQTGEGRNLDLVARFGVKRLKGTPAMFAIAPNGERINSEKDALSWRNAHSRSEAEVFGWIRNLAEES